MKLLCVICLIHVSLQLKCDKSQVAAPVGGEFLISCSYSTTTFLFNKKYWCRGGDRYSCEVVADSETESRSPKRSTVIDARRHGLYVKMTDLRLEDTDTYWVGIDKIYADVMTSVKVEVTEVPVSKPSLWPLSPLQDRPTCWGKAITVRCGSDRGTGVGYEWYQQNHSQIHSVSKSRDLRLHCGSFRADTCFYCVASNNIGQQQSDLIYVQVLMPSQANCIFAVTIQGQPIYDCADRLTTTTTSTTSLSIASEPTFTANSSQYQNQTHQDGSTLNLTLTFPGWYRFLRCGFLLSLLAWLLVVVRCTKRKHRVSHVRRRRQRECA